MSPRRKNGGNMIKKQFMPLNLQFFASSGDGDNNQGGEGQNAGDQNQQQNNSGDNNSQQQEKTFTQADMTATATREKKEGKNSILKLFGISDEKKAKEEAAAYKAWKDSQMTDDQKAKEAQTQLQTDKNEAEKRATLAENKLAAVMAGVNKESIEDALAIALLKVTEDKNLETVLGEMKEQAKYKGFFEEGSSGNSSDNGTGNGVGHNSNNKNKPSENIGKRLAEQNKSKADKKSNFFKN